MISPIPAHRWILFTLMLLGSPAVRHCLAQEGRDRPPEFFCVVSFQHDSAIPRGSSVKGQMLIEATSDHVSLIVHRDEGVATFALQAREQGTCFYGDFDGKGAPQLRARSEGPLDVDAVGPFAQMFVDLAEEVAASTEDKKRKLESLCKSIPDRVRMIDIEASFNVQTAGAVLAQEKRLAWQLTPATLFNAIENLEPSRTILSTK